MIIHQLATARHRNGICGAPFHVILFRDAESTKIGIVFDEPHHCAVLDVHKLAAGDIRFGSNSYRGDWFETSLRKCIADIDADNPATQSNDTLLDALFDVKHLISRYHDRDTDHNTCLGLIEDRVMTAIQQAQAKGE